MLPRSLATTLLLLATALPAPLLAADLGGPHSGSLKDAPFYVSQKSWSGAYFGLHGGYASGDSSFRDGGTDLFGGTGDISVPPFGAFACGPALTGNYCGTPFELDPEGGFGGLQLGSNWQNGRIVFGIEGDLGYLGVSEDHVLIRPFDDRDFASVEYGLYGTVTARIGYTFDRALLYLKGGFAVAHIETEAADIDLQDGSFEIFEGSRIRSSETQTGWALGAGVEYALSGRLSLKGEYLYMDFGSETSRSPQGDIYKQEHELHTAKLGLNYRLMPEPEPLR